MLDELDAEVIDPSDEAEYELPLMLNVACVLDAVVSDVVGTDVVIAGDENADVPIFVEWIVLTVDDALLVPGTTVVGSDDVITFAVVELDVAVGNIDGKAVVVV